MIDQKVQINSQLKDLRFTPLTIQNSPDFSTYYAKGVFTRFGLRTIGKVDPTFQNTFPGKHFSTGVSTRLYHMTHCYSFSPSPFHKWLKLDDRRVKLLTIDFTFLRT